MRAGTRAALPARAALRMATIEGAAALGLAGEIGSLEPGKAADLIRVSLANPRLHPIHDLASALVFAALPSDVVGTMVAVERTPRVRLRLAGSGLGPAAGLALLYLPLIGLPALVAWAVIRPLSPDRAWATAATITSAVGAAWVFSVIDPASPWGLVHGPETALWAAVVGGALLGRLAADQ